MIDGLDLKKELVRIFARELIARKIQIKVITADPRTHGELPCLAINRVNDDEGQIGFNNIYEQEFNEATEEESPAYLALMTETIELRLWTENANQRDDIYFIMKEIAILAKQELIKKGQGLGNMRITGGRDEQDFKTFEPYFIYWSVLNFIALNPLEVKPSVPTTGVKPILGVDGSFAMNGIEETEEDMAGT